MSVRIRIKTKCDRCGKKHTEYLSHQCSGDAIPLPDGWTREQGAFLDTVYCCDDCVAQLNEIIDNWRLSGINELSMRLYRVWSRRDALVQRDWDVRDI
jgi:hypothetical protein